MKYAILIIALAIAVWPVTFHNGALLNSARAAELTTDANNQYASQDANKNNNQSGGQEAAMLGMIAIAGGIAMIAAGSSMMGAPPTVPAGTALMAAGAVMLAAGMAGMAAASEMGNNQAASQGYANNLDATGISSATSTIGATAVAPLHIDPSLIENPKAQEILADMQAKSGISPQALADALNNGVNPLDLMAQSGSLKNGVTSGQVGGMLDSAKSAGLPSGAEISDKLGLSADDLAQLAKNSNMGDGAYAGAGASRSPASAVNSVPDFSAFGPNAGKDTSGASALGANGKLSDGVQSALDRSGITTRTLFQMVHAKYKNKTPMMFGNPVRKASASQTENPFGDLGKDQIEL